VGIVLRPRSVEVVNAGRRFGRIRIAKIVSVPIGGGEDDATVRAIQTALERAGARARRAVVCVPAHDALLRSFVMPLLPKGEWSTAIQFEARRYIPFKTDELAWGFHVEEQPSAKQMAVVFVGIQAGRAAQIRGWLSAAGVKGAVLEAPALSVSRLAGQAPRTPGNQFVGIVDVDLDADIAHLVIARGGVPHFARDVDLRPDQARPDAGPAAGAAELQAVDARAEVLLNDLRLSLDFFTRENPQSVISHLMVFGEPAVLGPWVSWLATQLPYSVAIGSLPGELWKLPGVGLDHAAALGLVLRELKPGSVKINLVSQRADQLGSRTRLAVLSRNLSPELLIPGLIRPAAMQLVAALLALGVLGWLEHRRVDAFQREAASIVASFPDVGWGLAGRTEAELQPLQRKVEARLKFLRALIRDRVSVTEKLDALAKTLPEGVWLEGVRYQDRLEKTGRGQASLTIQGACLLAGSEDELRVISEFVRRVKQDERFFRGFATAQLGEVTAVEDRATQASYRTFGLTCQAQRKL
jgi:Tfp pilus assembly PilM family ATPase